MPKLRKIRSILRQLNGEADLEEKQAFGQWLLEKAENLDLYIEIKNLWETPVAQKLKFDETKARERIARAVKKETQHIRIWQYAQRIAAIVILMLSVGTFSHYRLLKPQPQILQTIPVNWVRKVSGAGEQLRISLPDGSVVHLNAGSCIQFPQTFHNNYRQVILKGEAFFDVTKDPEHPFEVRSDEITTTVLGTSFNIKAYTNEPVTVTVASGKVKVVKDDKNQTDEILLHPNQQAIYSKQEKQLRMSEVIARDYYEWTNGIIRFNDDSPEEVVRILERWYNVHIQLNGIQKENIRVNGSYKDKKLYMILDGLSFMYGLEYTYTNDTTIIISHKMTKMN